MSRRAVALALLLTGCVLLALVMRGAPLPASAGGLGYVERVTGGAAPDARLPMVIAMHGLGDTPEDFVDLFRELDVPARVLALRAPDPWHGGFSWFPIDEPRARQGKTRERARAVAEVAQKLARERPTRGKPVVTGFSQGGMLSFALAAYHPGVIAAALPIAGMLEPGMPPPVAEGRALPVLAFHGAADPRIPYAEAQHTVQRLKSAGRAATLSSYEGVGHSIPPRMQRDFFSALREMLDLAARGAP